jgi:hypothetical protein
MILSPTVAIILSATTFFIWANEAKVIASKHRVNKLFFIDFFYLELQQNPFAIFINVWSKIHL